MKWVTRDHIHMDRVASPWLILRHIDPDGEIGFLPFGDTYVIPEGAIPFAIPGVELGPHDANGSTFRKLMRKYDVRDPALELMGDIVESGIHHVFHHQEPEYSVAHLKEPVGVGLDAIAHGMLCAFPDDAENLKMSMAMYDGLYMYCRSVLLIREKPEIARLPPPALWDMQREELRRAK